MLNKEADINGTTTKFRTEVSKIVYSERNNDLIENVFDKTGFTVITSNWRL